MKVCTGDEEKDYKCKHCEKKYKTKKELQTYRQTKHKVFTCGLCITQYLPPAHSNLHKQGHIETKYVLTV